MKEHCSKADTYSIIIRTLGTGGENYRRLLESIQRQSVQPEHIYVIIAHGYNLPPERIGTEEFVFTDKGMWHQRIFGIGHADKHSTSDYYLIMDDDVEFGSDFAREALATLSDNDIDLLSPQPLTIDGKMPAPTRRLSVYNIANVLMGRRFETRRHNMRSRIATTGGYWQNTAHKDDIVPNESGNGQVFFMRRDLTQRLRYEDEYWLDEGRYALPEDMVFFYKAHLNGCKIMFDRRLRYIHLDSGSSSPNRKVGSASAQGRNFIIFWHRFILSNAHTAGRRMACRAGITYRIAANGMAYAISSLAKFDFSTFKAFINGVRDARKYVKSESYRSLPSAINPSMK